MAKQKSETVYQEITSQIVAELEAGAVPWVQPWGTAEMAAPLGLPRNAKTGRNYSGINILILWHRICRRGYGCQNWLTFKQAKDLGGSVRKGERGCVAVYADKYIPRKERARAAQAGDEAQPVAFLKRFTLFNVEQCDGLPESVFEGQVILPAAEIVPQAEALIEASGADFRVGGNKAYYVPVHDYVQVPPQPAFSDQINFYRTALHEMGHWTGHASRLNRDQAGGFGSKDYAREELVAEMTAAFVCASLGIVPTVRHSDYIANWLEVIREDDKAIFQAASRASKAAEYLLAFVADESEAAA